MTTLDPDLTRIAADHAVREKGLTAFFLGVAKKSLRRVKNALIGGHDWLKSLRDVWRGNPDLELPDPAETLARGMADSHSRGAWQASRMAGVPRVYDARSREGVELYRPRAAEALELTEDGLAWRVERAVAGQRLTAALEGAAQAYRLAGLTIDKPAGARAAATRAVTDSYNAGLLDGYRDPEIAQRLTGLRHVSILDARTSAICWERHNLRLPVDHPYWFQNVPSLHPNCRSFLLPLFGAFEPSETLPTIPPVDGYGRMPSGYLLQYD